MVLLFKDSISGTAEAKVSDSDTSCKCMHESKAQTQYADHAQTMARTSNKISVPQERGRFAIGAAPNATLLSLDLAGLRSGLARYWIGDAACWFI
jgi:hypothetical protein